MRAADRKCLSLVALVMGVLLLAACGEDSSSKTTSADENSKSVGSGASALFSQENPGKADVDRTGEVIKIGFSNDGSGPLAAPEFLAGAEQAVKVVNENGGVNGATIELVPCASESTPESAINCANKSVQADVPVHYAGLDLGGDGALPVLKRAGIPYVTTVAWTAGLQTNPNAHALELGSSTFTKVAVEMLEQKGIKSVSLVQDGGPAAEFTYDKLLKPAADENGITATKNFVNPANPDWVSAVAAASARNAGAVIGFTTEDGCTKLVKAAQQVSFKGAVFAGSCANFIQALGKSSVGTYAVGLDFLPEYAQYAPPEIKKNLEVYEKAMTDGGQEEHLNGFAAWSFSGLMELRSILETIPEGPIDGKSVAKAFANAKAIPGFLGPQLRCAERPLPSEPTVCRNDAIPLQVVDEDGTPVRKPVYSDDFGLVTP